MIRTYKIQNKCTYIKQIFYSRLMGFSLLLYVLYLFYEHGSVQYLWILPLFMSLIYLLYFIINIIMSQAGSISILPPSLFPFCTCYLLNLLPFSCRWILQLRWGPSGGGALSQRLAGPPTAHLFSISSQASYPFNSKFIHPLFISLHWCLSGKRQALV